MAAAPMIDVFCTECASHYNDSEGLCDLGDPAGSPHRPKPVALPAPVLALAPPPAPIETAPIVPALASEDVAKSRYLVVEDGKEAGALVFWRLSGAMNHAALAAAWMAAGLPEEEVRRLPTPSEALRVAVRKHRANHVLARPLPTGDGWALVVEHPDAAANDLTWERGLKVIRNADNSLVFEPADHPAAAPILANYIAALETVHVGISSWLSGLVYHLGGTGLRERGGIYFIPADGLAGWKARKDVIAKVSAHTFSLIPAMKTEEAVAAILDALGQEALAEADAIQTEVVAGGLSARSLRTRIERTQAIKEKVARYSALLGTTAPGLEGTLTNLEAFLTAARIQAEAAAEAGRQ